ncbi:MAG: hypothetical protein WCP20_23485 [Desulfuromonadales bacterium]
MLADYKIVAPEFNKNYTIGSIGFSYNVTSPVSKGIAWFTRWDRMSDIKVSHALVVTGANECVEASASKNRVGCASLDEYFNDEHCLIFFRKPVHLTSEIAQKIVQTAKEQVGKRYDYSLIAAQAVTGSFIGHLINDIFKGDSVKSSMKDRDV